MARLSAEVGRVSIEEAVARVKECFADTFPNEHFRISVKNDESGKKYVEIVFPYEPKVPA